MDIRPSFDHESEQPIYRQLGSYLHGLIEGGQLQAGDRLPPTRELAGQLGLNRTTVSAAYEVLETEGLIRGEVGRGSYVCGPASTRAQAPLDWARMLTRSVAVPPGAPAVDAINFTRSSPSDKLFPIEEFRECCREVISNRNLRELMQLGSPGGYAPLRRYLLDRAVEDGLAGPGDDILITNGCQQALDLLGRALVRRGERVAIEEPVYPGLKNLFLEAGADLIGVAVGPEGIDPDSLQKALQAGAKVVVLTPSFQNPTGTSIPANVRSTVCAMARAAGAVVIENDIYSQLSYSGAALPGSGPRLKQLDPNVILLGSFSKVAFPGVRVGWIIAPRQVIARVTELKQMADLHTDHLSQAFVLRFAESGKLARHEEKVIAAAKEKLKALEQSLKRWLTGCKWTLPAGGMNIWIDLPAGLDAMALRGLAQQAGIDYLPGRYFSISRPLDNGLRLSFAGLEPAEIRKGIEILGGLIRNATNSRDARAAEPAFAMV
jgi:2-aminoadipate transaminase